MTWHTWCQFQLKCPIDNIQRPIKSKVLKLLIQNIMEKYLVNLYTMYVLHANPDDIFQFWFLAPSSMSYWFLCCYISERLKLAVHRVFAEHDMKKTIYFLNYFLKKSLFFSARNKKIRCNWLFRTLPTRT